MSSGGVPSARGKLISLSGASAGDWVVGTLGGRWMLPLSRGLFAGGTLIGQAFHVTRPTLYDAVTARLRPEIQWRGDGVTLSLKGRGAATHTATEVVDTTDGGGGGPPGRPGSTDPTVTRSTVTSNLSQVGGEAEARFDAGPGTVWVRGRSVDGEFGTYGSLGLGGSASTGPVSWSASVSYWDTPAGGELAGGVRMSVPLGGDRECAWRSSRPWPARCDGNARRPSVRRWFPM